MQEDVFRIMRVEKFISYLRYDCGLEENSIQKQYKNLAWFLRWAIRKGYTQERAVESFDPVFKTVKKPVIFLEKKELDKLYKYKIPKNGTVVKLKTYDGKKYEYGELLGQYGKGSVLFLCVYRPPLFRCSPSPYH